MVTSVPWQLASSARARARAVRAARAATAAPGAIRRGLQQRRPPSTTEPTREQPVDKH